jgi:hypothetical protein
MDRRRRNGPIAAVAAAGLVLAAGLFVAYLMQARSTAVSSDGAANALQAWDMLHGNVLLHGWHTSDVSFWATELPEFALVEAVHGLSPDVVHIASALTYTLIVLLTALVARGRDTGAGGYARAAVALVIVIAPLAGSGSRIFLLEPNHTGTAIPVLALILLVEWLPRRWYALLAVFGLLVLSQVSDELVMIASAAPLALVAALSSARPGSAGPGSAGPGSAGPGPAGPGRAWPRWYGGGLAIASLASIPVALATVHLIHAVGGYSQPPVSVAFTRPGAIAGAAARLWHSLRLLFGVAPDAATASWTVWPHYLGMALAFLGLAAGITRIARRTADWVTGLLVAGIVAVLAAGLLTTIVRGAAFAHEIAVLVPMSAALAGRALPVTALSAWRRWAWVAVAVVLTWCLAALGYAASAPAVPPQSGTLAAWLAAHHLTSGLGGYWEAASVTLDSRGAVSVAPVEYWGGADIRPTWWEVQDRLFDPARSRPYFVVNAGDLPYGALVALFGRPDHRYRYQQYTITVWHTNLLLRLRSARACSARCSRPRPDLVRKKQEPLSRPALLWPKCALIFAHHVRDARPCLKATPTG